MTTFIPALALAICDWVAVATGKKKLEYVFKPLTMVALIAVVLEKGAEDRFWDIDYFASAHTWRFLLAGLVFSLIGDVFLMLPSDKFVQGLAAFLIAHLCYTVAFIYSFRDLRTYAVAAVVAVTSGLLFVRVRRGIKARGQDRLIAPVISYVVMISAMVTAAVGTLFINPYLEFDGIGGAAVEATDPFAGAAEAAAIGAVLFYISDALIGWTRFVRDFARSRLAIMMTYHLGQIGLVVSLLRN